MDWRPSSERTPRTGPRAVYGTFAHRVVVRREAGVSLACEDRATLHPGNGPCSGDSGSGTAPGQPCEPGSVAILYMLVMGVTAPRHSSRNCRTSGRRLAQSVSVCPCPWASTYRSVPGPVALAPQQPRQCPCIAQGLASFGGAGIQINAPARRARLLDVLEQPPAAEPDRRAHRPDASERRAREKKGIQANQSAHRRSDDRTALAIPPCAVLCVDARLDRVDQESAVAESPRPPPCLGSANGLYSARRAVPA